MASTDLLGIMPSSIGPLLEKRLGSQVLRLPLSSTVVIYMIWHETRGKDTAQAWLRELMVTTLNRVRDSLARGAIMRRTREVINKSGEGQSVGSRLISTRPFDLVEPKYFAPALIARAATDVPARGDRRA